MLGLANKYDFNPLQQAILAYLKATLNVTNVCLVYNVASYYQLKDLCTACSTFVDMHASEVMKSEGFLSLSQLALMELCARDSFFAPEIEIYEGIVRWMRQNGIQPEEARELLRVIRLQLIPLLELLQEIRQSEMFEADDILDAISMKNLKREIELEQRGLLSKTATHTHKHTHARTHTQTHTRTRTHRQTQTHAQTDTDTHAHTLDTTFSLLF